jgi:hypothetical protein
MIPSCKNSRPVAIRLTAFSRYKETVDLGSVSDKKTPRFGGEFGNCPAGRAAGLQNHEEVSPSE